MGESKVGGSRDTELVSRDYRKPLIEKTLPILYRVFEWWFFTRNRAKNRHSLIPCEPRIPQMSQGYVRSSGAWVPGDHSAPSTLPAAFSESGQTTLPDPWWLAFDDPALNRLEARAMKGNFSLEAAWERFQQARAIARRERAD